MPATPTTMTVIDGTAVARLLFVWSQSGVYSMGNVLTDTNGSPLLPEAAALGDAESNPFTSLLGSCGMLFNGSTWERQRVPSVFKDVNTVTITAAETLWTPGGANTIRLMGGSFSVSAAGSVQFTEAGTTPGTVFRTPELLANTPYELDLPGGVLLGTGGDVLQAQLSVAGSITGTIWGTEE